MSLWWRTRDSKLQSITCLYAIREGQYLWLGLAILGYSPKCIATSTTQSRDQSTIQCTYLFFASSSFFFNSLNSTPLHPPSFHPPQIVFDPSLLLPHSKHNRPSSILHYSLQCLCGNTKTDLFLHVKKHSHLHLTYSHHAFPTRFSGPCRQPCCTPVCPVDALQLGPHHRSCCHLHVHPQGLH